MKHPQSINGHALVDAGRRVATPFQLKLDEATISPNYSDGAVPLLTITEILRIVPGVRLVGLALWEGKQIVVKLFYQPMHHKRHFRREVEGLDVLQTLELTTARCCFTARLQDASASLIATEFLQGAKSLSIMMRESAAGQRCVPLVKSVIGCIAQGHRMGVWQADIHPDNFLIRDDEVFQIDTAEIHRESSQQPSGLALDKSLSNLALFLAQFPVSQDVHVKTYLEHYAFQRGLEEQQVDSIAMLARITQARTQRLIKYEKKLVRATSEHGCRKTTTTYLLYDRSLESAEFERFISDPDSFIPTEGRIKNGNSSTVVKVTLDGRSYLLKRYNILGISHRIRRLFTRSRAVNSWIYASVLNMLGVSTGRPYAALERRILGFVPSTSYFLSEFIEGDHVLDTVLSLQEKKKPQEPNEKKLKELMEAFETLFSIFQRYRISHGDFKASNFIFASDKLFVLDLDSMKRHSNEHSFQRKYVRDVRRFIRNWQGSPLASDLEQRLFSKEGER